MDCKHERTLFIIKLLIVILTIILVFLIYCKESIDNIINDFHIKGKDIVVLEVGDEYKEEGAVATFNKKDISDEIKIVSNVDTSKVGTYTVSYSYYLKYFKVGKTIQRKVVVEDTQKPVLIVDSEKEIHVGVGQAYNIPSASATDNYDGDITNKIEIKSDLNLNEPGIYSVNYSVSDSSGNESTDKITINVEEKNAYIDVSISEQRLNYYEYGKLVLSSDIVTGVNNGTPTGNYRVLNKARNVTLKGADYTSFVNYWIAFIGHSYGIHDASWRTNFGGSIYKYNGSHGCINMPYTNASKLYNMVDIGTPVHVNK